MSMMLAEAIFQGKRKVSLILTSISFVTARDLEGSNNEHLHAG